MGKRGPVLPASELQHGKDKRTVFIRGIPFSMGESGLEALFSELGPVKQCFLVRPKGQEKHRGFGFVQFALPEDAERAAESLNGMEVDGRKLLVELADKRAPMEERKNKRKHESETQAGGAGQLKEEQKPAAATEVVGGDEEPPPPKKKVRMAEKGAADPVPPPKGKNEAKHKLLQAVALGNFLIAPSKGHGSKPTNSPGLSPELLPRAKLSAIAYAKSLGKVVEVMDPAPLDLVNKSHLAADGCEVKTPDAVVVVFYDSVKTAMEAVASLHGKWLSLAPSQKPNAGKKVGRGRKGKKGDDEEVDATAGVKFDLWARQLTGEGALVKKWRVIVRNLPFNATEGMIREALKAAGFVWELTLPRGADGKIKGFAFASFTCQAHAQKAISDVNGAKIGGRMVAVDWAVEKDKFESSKKQSAPADKEDSALDLEEEEEEKEREPDDDDDDDEEEEEEEIVEVDEKERSMLKSVIDQVLAGGEGEEREEEKEERPAQGAMGEKGKKVKVDPSKDSKSAKEADEDLVHPKVKKPRSSAELLEKKGPDYLSKTVFVRGLPLDATSVELQARMETFGTVHMCRVVMDKASGKPKGTAFVEYKSAADAVKATQACERGRKSLGPGVTLKGKLIDLDLAVDPDVARKLSESKAGGAGLTKDKRNLYLAKEGLIAEGTKAWDSLSDADKQKRKRAAEEMKQKLKSPNFMVSSTRLSLRNLPYELDEAKLKALAIAAVKQRATKETPRIMQVKVLRELEGRMGEDGKPRSKGMGFVEFADHDHAMTALRQLNNNPDLFGANRRPIVEFSVENVKVLQKLESIKAKKEALKQKQKASKGEQKGNKAEGGVKRSRGGDEAMGEDGEEEEDSKRQKFAPLNPEDEGKSKTQLKREKLMRSREKQKVRRQEEKEQRVQAKAEGVALVSREPPRKSRTAKSLSTSSASRKQPAVSNGAPRLPRPDEPAIASRRNQQRGEERQLEVIARQYLGEGGEGKKPRVRRSKETDKLDRLIESYARKLDPGKKKVELVKISTGEGIKRWFAE